MKKALYTLSLVALLAPAAAFAAPSGWLPPEQCTIPPDHAIWNNDSTAVTGCITSAAWDAAATAQVASGDQSKLAAFIFPPGTAKVGGDGVTYTCPWWFFTFSCILPDGAR